MLQNLVALVSLFQLFRGMATTSYWILWGNRANLQCGTKIFPVFNLHNAR